MAAPRACRYSCGHCICCTQCTALIDRCPSCRVGPIHVVATGAGLAFEDSFAAAPPRERDDQWVQT